MPVDDRRNQQRRTRDESKRFSWYEPIREEEALTRAVHFVLKRPGIFLNSSSDASLLKLVLEAASNFDETSTQGLDDAVEQDAKELQQEPLFIRGQSDDVR